MFCLLFYKLVVHAYLPFEFELYILKKNYTIKMIFSIILLVDLLEFIFYVKYFLFSI